MFGTKHNECVGFESRWKVKKVSTESTTQTTEFSVSDKGTNTLEKCNTGVQTVTDESTSTKNVETDMKKLSEWLKKIYPKVKKELDEANNSQAFKGHKLLGDASEANCLLLQTINISESTSMGSGDKATKVSAITWNETGKSIAVSCGYDHKSWCYHLGHVSIYFLDRDDKLPNLPRKKMSTESCVTNLKFHPVHPAIIAAGTFAGGVIIWNVQNDEGDDIIATVNAHEESITQLSWINDIDSSKNTILATSSTDGLLKLWNFNLTNPSMTVKAKYKIKAPIFANNQRNIETPENISKKISRGIICFDFSKHLPDMFVVGVEGGLVVQCSLLGASELKGSTKEEPLLDPVFRYYEPHEGEITSVSISPNRNDMFMTCGTDAEIRIYLFGQEDPAQVIFIRKPLNELTFVLHEEKLVAGCGHKGILEIFHLISGRPIENITTEKVSKKILTCLAVNTIKTNVVAVGNIHGDLQLWNVPWHLFAIIN